MKVHAFLMLLGALHGIFLAFVLLSRRGGTNATNVLLSLILLIFSGYLFEHYLILEDMIAKFPHLMAAFVPFLFLLGPLYFLVLLTFSCSRMLIKDKMDIS